MIRDALELFSVLVVVYSARNSRADVKTMHAALGEGPTKKIVLARRGKPSSAGSMPTIGAAVFEQCVLPDRIEKRCQARRREVRSRKK